MFVTKLGFIRCPIICCSNEAVWSINTTCSARGVALDSTRCAGYKSVKHTRWKCSLFASSHLLIASVEQLMEEEHHLSVSLLRADKGTFTTSG